MSGEEKQSNSVAASEEAQRILSGLDGYCSFSMKDISDPVPVQGSAVHDELGSSIRSSLESWKSLLISDAAAIEQTGLAFNEVDGSLARGLLGVGDE